MLILLVILTSLICLINAVSLVNQPFPGFLVNERMVLAYLGPSHWTGVQAGLKFPDKLLEADGNLLASPQDLHKFFQTVKPGSAIQYAIQRGEQVLHVSVASMRFTWLDLGLTFGIPFLVGIIYVILGVTVFVFKPDTTMAWVFLGSCALLSISNMISFDYLSTHSGSTLVYLLLIPYLAATVLHLSLIFPDPMSFVWGDRYLTVAPYIASTVLALTLLMLYPNLLFVRVYEIVLIYLVFSTLVLLGSSARSYLCHTSVLARARARVILWGAAFGLPLAASVPLLSSLGITVGNLPTTLGAIPLVIFPASIGYAIARHNLFDVDTYLKRAVGYGFMTAIVALAYFLVQTVVSTFVLRPIFGAQAESVHPFVFALLVVFFFNPVNRNVQETVERLFFRKAYDYKSLVATASNALSSFVDLRDFTSRVLQTFKSDMFLDGAGIILLDHNKQRCHCWSISDIQGPVHTFQSDPCPSYSDPLLQVLARERRLLTKFDIEEDSRFSPLRESCGQTFSRLGASLVLPLFYRDEFSGILFLGTKKSGHFYTREDIDLLKTLSSITSTAIEQEREKDQRAVLMQMFSRAVSPEVAETLWQQRDQFLDGGRPRSQKLIATVMFTDLEGFSTVSEKFEPEILMGWLNTYMEAITNTVMAYGGVVDDYFGDGVKVNFGVPVPRLLDAEIRQDAINAVTCTLALEREMVRLNAEMKERGLPTLRMRIGINTGPVVAGSLGGAERMKYTTLGDAVNTASRLESYDKSLVLPHLEQTPCRILISEDTLGYLGEKFDTVQVGHVALKGKEIPVTVHCVIGCRAVPRQGLPTSPSPSRASS